MNVYWTPRTKEQLVDWIHQYTHSNKGKWCKLTKHQLYAIYHKLRKDS